MQEICKVSIRVVKVPPLLAFWKKFTWRWFAYATGPKGEYVAAQSPTSFKAFGDAVNSSPTIYAGDSASDKMRKAREEVVAILLKDGWEPIDTSFFDQTFRRESQLENDEQQPDFKADSQVNVTKKLKNLKELREADLITQDEFEAKKKEILSRL